MREAPKDYILDSMYRQKLRDSEQLKTTFAVYNQDTVQKKEPPSYTPGRKMINRYLDSDGCQRIETKVKTTILHKLADNEWAKGQCSKGAPVLQFQK